MKNLTIYNIRQIFFAKNSLTLILLSSLIALISLYIMNDAEKLGALIPSLVVIFPITYVNCLIDNIFKHDKERGILDFHLISHEKTQVILAKFLCILALTFSCSLCIIIISYFISSLNLSFVQNITLAFIPLFICSSAVLTTLGAINLYFDNRSNLISALIIPFIFPSLILYGIFIENNNPKYFFISCGVAFILVPISIYLTNILMTEE
ncbi:MAG: ABC transporter permease [Rickettsiaceae bacterium]|nr:ABC transporter permease [Rickettsiaceae bacterium]